MVMKYSNYGIQILPRHPQYPQVPPTNINENQFNIH